MVLASGTKIAAVLALLLLAIIALRGLRGRRDMRAGVNGLRVVPSKPPIDPACMGDEPAKTELHVTVWIDSQEILSRSIPAGMSLAYLDDIVRDTSPPFVLTIERLGGCGLDLEWDSVFYGEKELWLEFEQIRGDDFEEWEDNDSAHKGLLNLTAPNSRMQFIFRA